MSLLEKNTLSLIQNHNSSKVRDTLLQKMESHRDDGLNCLQCIGFCCTLQANSMQISPSETLDLMKFFIKKFDSLDLYNSLKRLQKNLAENIETFRLNKDYSYGKRFNIRRYYTCPFFASKELGCTIDFQYKPYGCLAFEPTKKEADWKKRACQSDQRVLDESLGTEEKEINQKLKSFFSLSWDKKPIPVALFELLDRLILK